MIVPMKKVSLIIMGDKKEETLKKLRKLGMVHIEITEGSGERLNELKEQISLLESAVFIAGNKKSTEEKEITVTEALSVAKEISSLTEEKKECQAEQIALNSELERLKSWGDLEPASIKALAEKGVDISIYELPKAEYEALGESVKIVRLVENKNSIKCLLVKSGLEDEIITSLNSYQVE